VNIIVTSHGVARQTSRLIYPDSKPNKRNLIHIHSNAQTEKAITKPITTYAHSGNTSSTKNNTR